MRIGYGGAAPALAQFFRPPAQTPTGKPESTQSVSGEQSRSLQLTVKTAEGDTVTLSARALASFALESGQGRRSASSSQEFSIAVSVEGNLNQEELADIRKLAIALGKSIRQAERGELGKSLQTVAKASDEDTIAAFQFRYERRTELEYRQNAYQQISDLA